MSVSLVIGGCSFDSSPIFPGRDDIPNKPPPSAGRDAEPPPPPPPTAGTDSQPEAGPPPPTAGTDEPPPPEMDAAMAMDAQVAMDAAAPMDAAAEDGALPDAEPPDATPPDDGAAPDAVVQPDATVCPDPRPCVCAQHAPITPASDGCERPICPDQGCTPDSDCTLIYDRTSAYYFCTNETDWEDAAYHCELAGMDLAAIDDKQEDDLVHDHIEDKTWIGGHDGDGPEEGVFRWPDDRVFYRAGPGNNDGMAFGYVNWQSSEPNNEGLSDNSPADCVMYWFENDSWADGSCSDDHGYVCEVERE